MNKIREPKKLNDFNSTCMREVKNQRILKELKFENIEKMKKFENIEISHETLSEIDNLQSKISKKKKTERYVKIINEILNILLLSIAMSFMSFTSLRLLPEPYNIILAAGFMIPVIYNVGRYIRIYKRYR